MNSEREMAAARKKLRQLEALYDSYRQESIEGEHVRELTMRSLRRYITQFKEEISRFECHRPMKRVRTDLTSEVEAANTRVKLESLEALYEENRNETGDDQELRELSRHSLARLIKQLKEELIRYENRQRATKTTPVA